MMCGGAGGMAGMENMAGGMGNMSSGMGGGMGPMWSGQNQSLSQLFVSALSFLGQLASQLLIILTSGPVLGLLTAFDLLLLIAVLLRVLLGRRRAALR